MPLIPPVQTILHRLSVFRQKVRLRLLRRQAQLKRLSKKLSKNETVYVIADASGAAKKIIVSDWLKGVDTKGKVKDVSNLKDVKNVKGDETYTVNEDNAYEWAANGDDIYYQEQAQPNFP